MKTLIVNRNLIVSIFTVMLLTYSIQGVSYGQEGADTIVEFSDANLAREVRIALRLPTKGDVDILKIRKAELEKLTELDAAWEDITDLTGLEHATQLTNLNLGWNNISDATPLAQLTQLVELKLYGDQISDATPLAQLTQLETLDLRYNNISDVTPLFELTSLKQLELNGNPIEDMSPLIAYLDANPDVYLDVEKYFIREEGGPTLTATLDQPLTGATLDDARVTLTLSSGAFVDSKSRIEENLTLSGIQDIHFLKGNAIGSALYGDTQITIKLYFRDSAITTESVLTVTVGPKAIGYYNGPTLTVQIPVKGVTEAELAELSQAIVASTPYPLTEATLNGSIVTLTLANGTFVEQDWGIGFDWIRRSISVSGIAGVTLKDVGRVNDTKMTVELRFSGNINTDTTLVVTVGPEMIYHYNGPPRMAEIPVSATSEEPTGELIASTPFPLTKATLDDSFVMLTLQNDSYSFKADAGTTYGSWQEVGISGIQDVQTTKIKRHDVIRLSRSEILVKIDFQGDFNSDVTLTFTVPPRLIDNYNGPPLTAVLPVTVARELRVLIPELQGQPMFWVNTQTGKIESAGFFDAVTQGVTVLTMDTANRKLYWGERSKIGGTIKRANFDGTNVEALVSISSVPRGIAIDSVEETLYWTNSDLQIQAATLNGEDISTVIQLEEDILEESETECETEFVFLLFPIVWDDCDTKIIHTNLTSPTDIAVDIVNDRLYWTEFSGRIRRVNLDGTGLDTLLSDIGSPYGIVVADNKIYWAEEIDENSGKIQRANPNGTNIETLVTVQGLPTGISVDTETGKIYWANSLGGIQRTDINGGEVEVVVSGITAPGDFVLVPGAQSTTTTDGVPILAWDINADGKVNRVDLVIVSENFGLVHFPNKRADVNGDGTVDIDDLIIVAEHFGEGESSDAAAPASIVKQPSLDAEMIQTWLALARLRDDGSITFQHGITNLEMLLATVIPEQTKLLVNYPNPFNPETWIPYHLAKPADVTLHIYAVNGQLVRTLTLGHQAAGMYQSRSRAAYWDGKNAFGESVASGVYFYRLIAGDFTATRKMLIRK